MQQNVFHIKKIANTWTTSHRDPVASVLSQQLHLTARLESCLNAQLTAWWSRWFTVWVMDYLSGWWEQSFPGLLTAAPGAFSQRCSQLQCLSDFCVHSHRGDKLVPYEDGKKGPLKQEEKTIGQALEGSVESPRKKSFLSVWMEVRP